MFSKQELELDIQVKHKQSSTYKHQEIAMSLSRSNEQDAVYIVEKVENELTLRHLLAVTNIVSKCHFLSSNRESFVCLTVLPIHSSTSWNGAAPILPSLG